MYWVDINVRFLVVDIYVMYISIIFVVGGYLVE